MEEDDDQPEAADLLLQGVLLGCQWECLHRVRHVTQALIIMPMKPLPFICSTYRCKPGSGLAACGRHLSYICAVNRAQSPAAG